MNDVDAASGPLTFLPADISRKVANSLSGIREQERVSDELVYQHASKQDAMALTGTAGTGAVVEFVAVLSFRCTRPRW